MMSIFKSIEIIKNFEDFNSVLLYIFLSFYIFALLSFYL